MDEFTIGLALYDFLPVIFTGTAVYRITQLAALTSPDHKYMAGIGTLLVTLAGLSHQHPN